MNYLRIMRVAGVVLIISVLVSACQNADTTPLLPDLNLVEATVVEPEAAATTPQAPAILPTPTATPAPVQIISQGQRDYHNGDWDAALASFECVLNDPSATLEEQMDAQYGVALVETRRGDPRQALAALTVLIENHPGHEKAIQAYFLRGDSYASLENWAAALEDYEAYLTARPGVIDSYVYERIGDAYSALGQIDAALQAYDAAVAAERHRLGQIELLEQVAELNSNYGNTMFATELYAEVLLLAQGRAYRAQTELFIGQKYYEGGEYDLAYEQWAYVFETYPDTYSALSALRALIEADKPIDQYMRGVVNFNNDQYSVALEAFLNHLATAAPDEYPDDIYLYTGRSYRLLGNNAAARAEFQKLLDTYTVGENSVWGEAWLELAAIELAIGNSSGALELYEMLINEYPELPQTADALVNAAELMISAGDVPRAASYYQRLGLDFPDDQRAYEGLFKLALNAYRSGDFETAQALFKGAAELPGNQTASRDLLWLGKTLEASGRSDAAMQAYLDAANTNPYTYYGLRAAQLGAGQTPFVRGGNIILPYDDYQGIGETEAWLVAHFELDATLPLHATLRPDLASDPRLMRGDELWELGILTDARYDFEALRKEYLDDPLASYQLAYYFREIGLYRSSILAALTVVRLAELSAFEVPGFLARLLYPVYFSELVLSYSEQYELDPLYVYALIWQESLFEGFAVSSASAQGLMQIWPPTGEDIAEQLAWPDYAASDLQRPVVSVAFGTWLLNDEFRRQKGNAYAVLAAYNAGTGRALDWLEESGGDYDLYVELVSLNEPQTYIQRISEHFTAYSALYGEGQ